MKREKALETVKELPLEFEVEELIERLILAEKIEKGLRQIDSGKTVSHQALKEMTKKS